MHIELWHNSQSMKNNCTTRTFATSFWRNVNKREMQQKFTFHLISFSRSEIAFARFINPSFIDWNLLNVK